MGHAKRIWTYAAVTGLAATLASVLALRAMNRHAAPALHSRPVRIVALSPGIAEILYALVGPNRIVGVTDNTRHPSELSRKQHVGGFFTPSLEEILKLEPDLVVCRKAQKDFARRLTDLGLPIVLVADETLSDLLDSILTIGSATGEQRRSEKLHHRMSLAFKKLRQRATHSPGPRVLLVIGRADETLRSLYAASPKTILGQILELAGARNVITSSTAAYPVVSVEALESTRPDVIIELAVPPAAASPDTLRRSWLQLSCVSQGKTKVFLLDDDAFLIPGPRLVEAARKLDQILSSLHSRSSHVP